jgi:predicted nucleotidyltransferase
MRYGQLDRSEKEIQAFCRKWKLAELSIFGSALRDHFSPGSDIGVLVTFAAGSAMTFEGYVEMKEELSALFGGREVDLVEKRLVRNPFRRHEILTKRKVVFAA